MSEAAPRIRADKWLWQARFFKTRSKSAAVITAGHLRVNGARVEKPSAQVSVGDTLTFPQERNIRVVKILGLGTRRGPAAEAQALYDDLSPAPEKTPPRAGPRPRKKERRDAKFEKDQRLE